MLTNTTYSSLGIFQMPNNMVNVKQLLLRDYNLGLSVTQMNVQRGNATTIDKSTSVTLNSAGLAK